MSPEQCRAARAWLNWSQQDLSALANIGLSTIRQFENGLRKPIANNLLAMRRAFEEAAVTFSDEPAGITVSGNPSATNQNGSGEAPK